MLGKEFGPIAVSTILGAFQDRPLVFVSSCELVFFHQVLAQVHSDIRLKMPLLVELF